MKVETFEIAELDENLEPDCSEEQIKLIESLGLDGQRALISKDKSNAGLIPYRTMTQEENAVYRTICPKSSTVEAFSSHAIPLRVLQIVAHARSLSFFKEIRVWSMPDAVISLDPVLVGVGPTVNYSESLYLLARWGEELEPFSRLREVAAEKIKKERIDIFKQIQVQVNADLQTAEAISGDAHLRKFTGSPPYYHA